MKPAGARAFVALGSNLGDRRAWLDGALGALRCEPGIEVVAVSDWIETPPVGGPPGQGDFLNGVVELRTQLEPHPLLACLQRLEAGAGRVREQQNGPRTLDLDLLLYDELQIETPQLCLPHPRMHERLFVLVPLAQLAGELWLVRASCSVASRCAQLAGHLNTASAGA